MKQTSTLPHDFIIFCWLPPVGAYQACMQQSEALLWTEALVWNVRSGGWPFSLEVRVPADPGGMFPAQFGRSTRERRSLLCDLSYVLNPADFEAEDEDDLVEWCLFDEDSENELEGSDTEPVDPAPDFRVLAAMAIHMVEQAQGQELLVLVAAACLMGLQPEVGESSSCAASPIPHARGAPLNAAIPKNYEARGSSTPPLQGL